MAPPRTREAERDRKCINAECEYHNKIGSMIRMGNSGKNEYYQCRRCKKGYSSTYGTIFYKKKTDPEEMVKVLKSLAEGNTIRGAGRIFKHDKNAIINWLIAAGKHCDEFEKQAIDKFNFNQVQIDELWTFILKKTTHQVGEEEIKQKQSN